MTTDRRGTPVDHTGTYVDPGGWPERVDLSLGDLPDKALDWAADNSDRLAVTVVGGAISAFIGGKLARGD